jgi:hypothetical protein
MNHVLLGATLPLLVCAALYVRAGGRASLRLLVLGPIAMGLSGAWAVVPDMPRVLHDLPWYVELHHHPRCNVFWLHCWIDRDEADWAWYPVAFVLLGALLLAVAWREVARTERGGGDPETQERPAGSAGRP